ncbi:nuclear transport factor 2 family protein [Bacillus shivajii]|uniref:nuclear transport factor 2 family protein n=1 Tax=Bacillus shivajii TaxID=1983719 RepID=UPI001CF996F8|nr:nuclear transport factor 2 family protein [Bacillus shivajii]UCZ55228.1 nuclear transport factor 2 family protein [Bacillus shivajii]
MNKAEELAQKQLDAYNNGDIDAFIDVYAEDVQVFDFPSNELKFSGLAEMRERYGKLFKENPNQHAALLSRMSKGKIVFDHEHVTGRANGQEVYAIAMYEVEGDKIKNVWFVR